MAEPNAKPNRKLLTNQCVLAEYQRTDWVTKPEQGTSIEEMKNPEYWANVARDLKVLDRIEVRPADATWWAELLVRAVGPFTTKVHVLRVVVFDQTKGESAAAPTVPAGYAITHRGKNGWTVIRKSDNAILKEGIDTQPAAHSWLDAHLKTFT
jgi:hypothetical protein